jgi:hypothetical protein
MSTAGTNGVEVILVGIHMLVLERLLADHDGGATSKTVLSSTFNSCIPTVCILAHTIPDNNINARVFDAKKNEKKCVTHLRSVLLLAMDEK